MLSSRIAVALTLVIGLAGCTLPGLKLDVDDLEYSAPRQTSSGHRRHGPARTARAQPVEARSAKETQSLKFEPSLHAITPDLIVGLKNSHGDATGTQAPVAKSSNA